MLLTVVVLLLQGCSNHRLSSEEYKKEFLQWMEQQQAQHIVALTNWKEDVYNRENSYVLLFYSKVLLSSSPQFHTGDIFVSWTEIDENIDTYMFRKLTRVPNEDQIWFIAFHNLNVVETKTESLKINQTDLLQRKFYYISDLPAPVMYQGFTPNQPELAVALQAFFDIQKASVNK